MKQLGNLEKKIIIFGWDYKLSKRNLVKYQIINKSKNIFKMWIQIREDRNSFKAQ